MTRQNYHKAIFILVTNNLSCINVKCCFSISFSGEGHLELKVKDEWNVFLKLSINQFKQTLHTHINFDYIANIWLEIVLFGKNFFFLLQLFSWKVHFA